jgi:hypothetical protein
MLSEQPLIYIIDDFLSAAECTRFLERAAGRMRRAQVVRGASDDLGAPRAYRSTARTSAFNYAAIPRNSHIARQTGKGCGGLKPPCGVRLVFLRSTGRTNSNCWISNYDPALAGVEQRICAMLQVPSPR